MAVGNLPNLLENLNGEIKEAREEAFSLSVHRFYAYSRVTFFISQPLPLYSLQLSSHFYKVKTTT